MVSMPEYWTVLKTLVAVTRASSDLVSLKAKVRESEESTATVPGPWMELRDAVP